MAKKVGIRTEFREAGPLSIGNTTLRPVSQAVMVHLPFGQFVWNRPSEVVVENGGQARHIPVVDVTRMAQIAIYGLSFGLFIAAIVARHR